MFSIYSPFTHFSTVSVPTISTVMSATVLLILFSCISFMFVGDRDGPVIIVVLPPSASQLDVICGAEQVYSPHHQ